MVDAIMRTDDKDDDEELLTGNDIGHVQRSRRQTLTKISTDIERVADDTAKQEDSSGRLKKEELLLSYEETDALLKSLEEATKILTSHYELLQQTEKPPQGAVRSSRCQKVSNWIWKLLYKFTGARAITATILLQLVCLVMLTIIDGISTSQKTKHDALEAGSIVMMILQLINLVIVVMISVQLVDQFQKKRVSRVLLLQYFVTTILLFAGIYTATYRMNLKSWKFVENIGSAGNPALVVTIYTRFLFFSSSTATLCGAADALPMTWYTCLFVSAQMLLSFVYFTSVLSNVVSYTKKPKARALEVQKELQTLRKTEWSRQTDN